jgi:regulator of protease activity HflC (stomatin/prohibitin superfamily)
MEWAKQLLEAIQKLFIWWVIINPWEMGVRSRAGRTAQLLNPGCHFRIPYFDTVLVQPVRERVTNLSPQVCTTLDKEVMTLAINISYQINDISKVYNTIHNPEGTICSIAMGEASKVIGSLILSDCHQRAVESAILESLDELDIGIKIKGIRIVTFAKVRTYRIIQDSHWLSDSNYETKK